MNFEELSDDEILSVAEPIMDNLMQASTNIDHVAHIKDFTERLKNIVTKDFFKVFVSNINLKKAIFQKEKL